MTSHRPHGSTKGFLVPPTPEALRLQGQYAGLEPLQAEHHAALLFRAFGDSDQLWTYLPYGPFHSAAQYHRWVRDVTEARGRLLFALLDRESGAPVGVAGIRDVAPQSGGLALDDICLSSRMARTRAGSEALILMLDWVFSNGYLRCEWCCDARDLAARRAAQRLGFSFEGVSRQTHLLRGQARDTARYAITHQEWPALHQAYQAWLHPKNFDGTGRQAERLSDLTRLARYADDPALI